MNSAHLHLIITHVPIFGTIFGLCLLLAALVKRSDELKRTSLWIFFLAGVAVVPTYLTGRPAGALLMKMMPAMSMDAGDQHAEVAVVALTAASILGLVALVGALLYPKGKNLHSGFIGLILALALGTAATLVWTAALGGRIHHPEIQSSP